MTVALVSLVAAARATGKFDVTAPAAAVNTVDAAVVAVDYTTVAANIATLVADAALPTQAHVNTLNTNWSALKTLIDTAVTASAASKTATGHTVTVQFDVTDFNTNDKLKAAFDAFLLAARGSGIVAR